MRLSENRSRFFGWRFAAIVALLSVGVMTGSGSAIAHHHECDRGVAIVPVTGDVTVFWKIRSEGPVCVRLYREQPSGREVLVKEVIAEPGMSSHSFVDAERPPGSTLYRLRVLDGEGKETTLASALCVEPSFAPSDVSSPAGSNQPAWTRETIEFPDTRSSFLADRFVLSGRGVIPAPEPPIPR